jgi:RHS repeat-associated protein
MLMCKHSIDGGKTIADYHYFASGKVKQLETGVDDVPAAIKYHYNQRDWMTVDSTVKFWEHLGYNNIAEAGTGYIYPTGQYNTQQQFNGNISWNSYYMSGVTFTEPGAGSSARVGYSYSYDDTNRLKDAYFAFWDGIEYLQPESAYNEKSITYDNSGNLLTLQRYNQSAIRTDNLTYHYRENTDVDTLISNSDGTGAAYTYDNNGNMTSDSRDSIAFIIYNIDNLPLTEYKNNGTVINYRYDVDGNRISKVIGSSYTYYVRGKDGETDAVIPAQTSTNEVYNILGNGEDNIAQQQWGFRFGFTYYYYLKDHLGSIKMILNSSGGVDSYNDYYPYGMQMPGRNSVSSADARYKYTSKELDAETNLYYYGARYYNSWSGQWGQVDPKQDKYPSWSSYNYTLDNPIKFLDPNGKNIKDSVAAEKIKEAQEQLEKEREELKKAWEKKDILGILGHTFAGIWDAIKRDSYTYTAIPEVGALDASASEFIGSVAKSAAEPYNEQISVGARSLAKKLGHAESGGYESAFRGIKPTTANAQSIVKDILINPARVVKTNVSIDIYNSAGQGVRLNAQTLKFEGFLEGSKATR